jgi:glycosyltransferase involved in cell wall biosynthesis
MTSVIICCYNSSQRLPKTIEHLAQQKTDIDWEIIVVDNNSTDNTAEVAKSEWNKYNNPVSFRVVKEPVAGLSTARERGIKESKGKYIIFCDDDNWLAPDYVQNAYNIMENNQKIGALGGWGEAVADIDFPDWFQDVAGGYATGKQAEEDLADVTEKRKYVYGAGMILRKSALEKLEKVNFKTLLSDRKGSALSSGGDTELCYALILAGYRIFYSSSLKFMHYIPANRLTKEYVFRLYKGLGQCLIMLEAYQYIFNNFDVNKKLIWLRHYWKFLLTPFHKPKTFSNLLNQIYRQEFKKSIIKHNFKFDRIVKSVHQLKIKLQNELP